MITLLLIQLLAGAAAGYALEYLIRTKPKDDAVTVRWLALVLSMSGLLAYAYVLGFALKLLVPSELAILVSLVVLSVAGAATFALRRRHAATAPRAKRPDPS